MLALQHGEIPATLHFQKANQAIDFDTSPFYVVDRLTQWRREGGPRRAGVSSFGIGGTNAHVVLEEAPDDVLPQRDPRSSHLLVLSAKTPTALDAATTRLKTYLEGAPDADLADIAFTLQAGRREFNQRRTVVCRDAADGAAALGDGRRIATGAARQANAPVVFMFPGQGSQRVGAGRDLYATERVFRETLDQCAEGLLAPLALDLRGLLFPEPGGEQASQELLKQTRFTQPALFALELSLARLWMSWGVEPAAMIGHSVGEYTAACLAGVFSLEDGLRLIAERGRLIQEQPHGAMLAVMRPVEEIASRLGDTLSVAAVNAPSLCVVSGTDEAIGALEAELLRDDIPARRLATSHAFHSAMMEPVLAPFTAALNSVSLHAPRTPYISNVTGTWIKDEEAVDPAYWTRHLRGTVRFADGADTLLEGDYAFLELGPGSTLTTLTRQQSRITPEHTVTASLPMSKGANKNGAKEWDGALEALASLWRCGVGIDWQRFQAEREHRRTPLPGYPFERRRHWVEPGSPQTVAATTIRSERRAETDSESSDGPTALTRNPPPDQTAPTREAAIREVLREELEKLSGLGRQSYSDSTTFLELGLDSLLLAQFSFAIEKIFKTRLGPKHLSGKDANLTSVAGYLAKQAAAPAAVQPVEDVVVRAADTASTPSPESDGLAAVQAQVQRLTAQVETLSRLVMQQTHGKHDSTDETAPGAGKITRH